MSSPRRGMDDLPRKLRTRGRREGGEAEPHDTAKAPRSAVQQTSGRRPARTTPGASLGIPAVVRAFVRAIRQLRCRSCLSAAPDNSTGSSGDAAGPSLRHVSALEAHAPVEVEAEEDKRMIISGDGPQDEASDLRWIRRKVLPCQFAPANYVVVCFVPRASTHYSNR